MAHDDFSKKAAKRVEDTIKTPKNLAERYKLEWARSVLDGDLKDAHYYWERYRELTLAGYEGKSFTKDLERLTRNSRNSTPPNALKIQDLATQDLKRSGIMADSLGQGELAPDFTLPSVWGNPVTLSEALKENPVVLSFYRGAWCPFCTLELEALDQAADRIREAGGILYNVSPQTMAMSLSTAEKLSLNIPLLSDRGNKVAKLYGITYQLPVSLIDLFKSTGLDLELYNDEDTFTLPLPATFVIDRQRRIRLAFKEADYTKRLDPELIITFLQELESPDI